jgi:hypothetical protein
MPRNLFSRVPSGAVRRLHDGHLYAYVPDRLCNQARTVEHNPERPALVRFDPPSFHKGGEAYVWIGRIGDALPNPQPLPFSVTIEPRHA